jgi:hypothetical protein
LHEVADHDALGWRDPRTTDACDIWQIEVFHGQRLADAAGGHKADLGNRADHGFQHRYAFGRLGRGKFLQRVTLFQ